MIDKVLIVEDLPEVSLWLTSILKKELGIKHIYQAATVRQALQINEREDLCLALVDLGLPDGSGLEVIRAIKTQQADCNCVVSTIFDDSEHLFAALRAGADGYVLKDDNDAEVVHLLKGIIDGRPPISAAIAKKMLQAFRPTEEETARLAPREEQVLSLIARGYSVPNAAELLDISPHTVAGYLKIVYQKLQVNNRAEATIKAYDMGLIRADEPQMKSR